MSKRTKDTGISPDSVVTPYEHGGPCFSGVGSIDGKWAQYFMLDGGKIKQYTNFRFDTVDEAVEFSMRVNAYNGLRFT